MVTDNYTYCGDHFTMHTNIVSLCLKLIQCYIPIIFKLRNKKERKLKREGGQKLAYPTSSVSPVETVFFHNQLSWGGPSLQIPLRMGPAPPR